MKKKRPSLLAFSLALAATISLTPAAAPAQDTAPSEAPADAKGDADAPQAGKKRKPGKPGAKAGANAKARQDRNEGFSPLFNGKDLTGWVDVGTGAGKWKADNGLLVVEEAEGGWLRTEKEYKNFILQLDYKLPPGGNSGVFLHAPAEGNPAFAGLEIQILDHFHESYQKPGHEIKPAQYTGSVYDVVAAKDQKAIKPAGEWNKYRIRLKDNKIRVTLNGKLLVDADLSQFPDKLKDHPGLTREKGYIGLQSHGSRAEFRNITIKEIE